MNICITNTDSNPNWIGGIKRVAYILGNEWRKKGHNVVFMSLCTSPDKYDNIHGIPQYFLPDDSSLQLLNSEQNYRFLMEFIHAHQIDILLNPFCNTPEMVALCARIRANSQVKLVSALHFAVTHQLDIIRQSFFIKNKQGTIVKRYFRDLLLWLRFVFISKRKIIKAERNQYRDVYNSSDLTVLLSNRFFPDFKKLLRKQIDPSKLIAINNPILPIVHEPKQKKEKIILWCGRVEYGHKILDLMLKIWEYLCHRHPDWQLIVLGGGNANRFEELCNVRNIRNITFAGFQNPDDYYARASILCMTSVSEGWGMVLVEAQSYGCVPIAYNSFASLGDIITNDENGIIVPAFDERQYIERLNTLMNNQDYLEHMSTAAQRSVARFYASDIAALWLKEFENIKTS